MGEVTGVTTCWEDYWTVGVCAVRQFCNQPLLPTEGETAGGTPSTIESRFPAWAATECRDVSLDDSRSARARCFSVCQGSAVCHFRFAIGALSLRGRRIRHRRPR
jgi:hypothetical protein